MNIYKSLFPLDTLKYIIDDRSSEKKTFIFSTSPRNFKELWSKIDILILRFFFVQNIFFIHITSLINPQLGAYNKLTIETYDTTIPFFTMPRLL